MMKKIDISILGLGNLGTAFFEGLHRNSNVNLHLYEENEQTRRSLLKLYDTKILPNVEIIDSEIISSKSEDAINLISSVSNIQNLKVQDIQSDAIDIDFGTLNFSNYQ